MRRVVQAGLVLLLVTVATGACSTVTSRTDDDPFQWLEPVNTPEVAAWVSNENQRTLTALTADPRYQENVAHVQALAESPQRLSTPQLIGGAVFNFWRDKDHPKGLWRRTTVSSYHSAQPLWTTILDLDRRAEEDHTNWVWKGAQCSVTHPRRCLVRLSDGGEDAVTIREFDTQEKTFVEGGFSLPRGKQDVDWLDDATLLVSREWNPGEVTTSGYPFIVKTLRRGELLSQASEVGRGETTDMQESASVVHCSDGHTWAFLVRSLSFFHTELHLLTSQGIVPVGVPQKSSIEGCAHDQLIFRVDEEWQTSETRIPVGSVVAIPLTEVTGHNHALHPKVVWQPGPRDALEQVAIADDAIVINSLHEVSSQLSVFSAVAEGGWQQQQVQVPELSSVSVLTSSFNVPVVYYSVTSFLTPTSLWQLDMSTREAHEIHELPAQFSTNDLLAETHIAVSKDGTSVPYFVIRRKNIHYNGKNPTIVYGYGGFQNAQTPYYSAINGSLWLDKGGVYVVANIRGGGEFGPPWHEAALTVHRQRSYDDFYAVAENLIAQQITSPRYLGIEGASNGGLLMGVAMVQRPNLWHAVDIGVPLLDMLRYEHIAAGASWVEEYGSVNDPQDKAFLTSISPYHALRRGIDYPVPFIWTTTKDDRVGPQHARKFAAKLASFGDQYYFYEVTDGGHGAGASIAQSAITIALQYTYFQRALMS